ncbi:hypothetical protein ACFL1H_05140, partial [Nanoarchaeota archaeon]
MKFGKLFKIGIIVLIVLLLFNFAIADNHTNEEKVFEGVDWGAEEIDFTGKEDEELPELFISAFEEGIIDEDQLNTLIFSQIGSGRMDGNDFFQILGESKEKFSEGFSFKLIQKYKTTGQDMNLFFETEHFTNEEKNGIMSQFSLPDRDELFKHEKINIKDFSTSFETFISQKFKVNFEVSDYEVRYDGVNVIHPMVLDDPDANVLLELSKWTESGDVLKILTIEDGFEFFITGTDQQEAVARAIRFIKNAGVNTIIPLSFFDGAFTFDENMNAIIADGSKALVGKDFIQLDGSMAFDISLCKQVCEIQGSYYILADPEKNILLRVREDFGVLDFSEEWRYFSKYPTIDVSGYKQSMTIDKKELLGNLANAFIGEENPDAKRVFDFEFRTTFNNIVDEDCEKICTRNDESNPDCKRNCISQHNSQLDDGLTKYDLSDPNNVNKLNQAAQQTMKTISAKEDLTDAEKVSLRFCKWYAEKFNQICDRTLNNVGEQTGRILSNVPGLDMHNVGISIGSTGQDISFVFDNIEGTVADKLNFKTCKFGTTTCTKFNLKTDNLDVDYQVVKAGGYDLRAFLTAYQNLNDDIKDLSGLDSEKLAKENIDESDVTFGACYLTGYKGKLSCQLIYEQEEGYETYKFDLGEEAGYWKYDSTITVSPQILFDRGMIDQATLEHLQDLYKRFVETDTSETRDEHSEVEREYYDTNIIFLGGKDIETKLAIVDDDYIDNKLYEKIPSSDYKGFGDKTRLKSEGLEDAIYEMINDQSIQKKNVPEEGHFYQLAKRDLYTWSHEGAGYDVNSLGYLSHIGAIDPGISVDELVNFELDPDIEDDLIKKAKQCAENQGDQACAEIESISLWSSDSQSRQIFEHKDTKYWISGHEMGLRSKETICQYTKDTEYDPNTAREFESCDEYRKFSNNAVNTHKYSDNVDEEYEGYVELLDDLRDYFSENGDIDQAESIEKQKEHLQKCYYEQTVYERGIYCLMSNTYNDMEEYINFAIADNHTNEEKVFE